MATVTQSLRPTLIDDPRVGLVAFQAFHALLHMEAVLPYGGFVHVTFTQTVLRRQLDLPVRLMALVTLEARHRAAGRNSVTLQTPVLWDHGGRFFTKGVALQAGERLHAHTVNSPVLMTALACVFVRPELMEAPPVTHLAFDALHEYMFRVAIGFPEGDRALGYFAQVAALTLEPGSLSAVGPGKGTLSLHHIRYEKMVLFDETEVVAFLADNVSVLAPLPLLKRFLHHMT